MIMCFIVKKKKKKEKNIMGENKVDLPEKIPVIMKLTSFKK